MQKYNIGEIGENMQYLIKKPLIYDDIQPIYSDRVIKCKFV